MHRSPISDDDSVVLPVKRYASPRARRWLFVAGLVALMAAAGAMSAEAVAWWSHADQTPVAAGDTGR